MKALRVLVDLHSGENLDISTVNVDPIMFANSDLDGVETHNGEKVYARYTDDFSPGPELELECDFEIYY